MGTNTQRVLSLVLPLACATTLSACGDIELDPGEFGDDEIGTQFFDYDFGTGPLDGTECLTNGKEGAYGYVAQCTGFLTIYIEYIYDGGSYNLVVPTQGNSLFGDGYEPYEDPKVMACCAPYDQDKPLSEQEQFIFSCMLDARQQACTSMVVALDNYIDTTLSGSHKSAIQDVRDFLNSDQSSCIDALGEDYPDGTPTTLARSWLLPSEASDDPALVAAEISISTQLFEVHQPEDPTTCESMHENNTTFFEEQLPPYEATHTMALVDGTALLAGPAAEGYSFPTQGVFSSFMTGCLGTECSRIDLSVASDGHFALHEMWLALDEDITLSNGLHSLTITNPHLELYGPSQGAWRLSDGANSYSVDRGANFLVVGQTKTGTIALHAQGTTPVTATREGDEWFFDSFRVRHNDGTSDTWTLVVQPTEWLGN